MFDADYAAQAPPPVPRGVEKTATSLWDRIPLVRRRRLLHVLGLLVERSLSSIELKEASAA